MAQDWVQVKLTKKGEEVAAGGTLGVGGSRYNFEFSPGADGSYAAQRVTRGFDWEVLKRELRDGEPLFEIVEAGPVETAAANAPRSPRGRRGLLDVEESQGA